MRQFPISFFAGRDPLVAAYATASGATNLDGIAGLIAYLRAEGLIDNFRLYPMKSSQNAGTGTTVYGIGGLTSNNGTLVNGPSWGTGGVAFTAASSHYMTIADFLSDADLTYFFRANLASTGVDAVMCGQRETPSKRSAWLGASPGNGGVIYRSSTGEAGADFEVYTYTAVDHGNDCCYVGQWVDGGARSMWLNKVSQGLSLAGGFSAQTERLNTDAPFTVMAAINNGSPALSYSGTVVAVGVLEGALPTTTQREAITDFINAL